MKQHLPAQGYLYLAALALRHHSTLSKGRLAREIRANHTMVTKILGQLVGKELALVSTGADGAYEISASTALRDFIDQHGSSLAHVYEAPLREHYQYGRKPAWTSIYPWIEEAL